MTDRDAGYIRGLQVARDWVHMFAETDQTGWTDPFDQPTAARLATGLAAMVMSAEGRLTGQPTATPVPETGPTDVTDPPRCPPGCPDAGKWGATGKLPQDHLIWPTPGGHYLAHCCSWTRTSGRGNTLTYHVKPCLQFRQAPPDDDLTPARDLQLHLLSTHCNLAAMDLNLEEATEQHNNEHRGPCTIRNHPYDLHDWDPLRIVELLGEGDTERIVPHEVVKALGRDALDRIHKTRTVGGVDPTRCPHGYAIGEVCDSGFCGDGTGSGIVTPGDLAGGPGHDPVRNADFARGYELAIARLRDGTRYQNWWTAQQYPPGEHYWEAAPRNHLADYLQSVGP